jgi:hypothetical protein
VLQAYEKSAVAPVVVEEYGLVNVDKSSALLQLSPGGGVKVVNDHVEQPVASPFAFFGTILQ